MCSSAVEMSLQDRIVRRSRILLCIFGFLSLVLLSVLTALAILDLSATGYAPQLKASAAATVAFNLLALFSIIALVILYVRCSGRGWLQNTILPLTGFLLAVTGSCLSMSTFIIRKANKTKMSSLPSFSAEAAIWIFSAVTQVLFYTVIVLGRRSSDGRSTILSFQSPKPKRPAPERPPTPPTPLRIVAPPYALPQAHASPSFPLDPCRASWRNSLHSLQQAVRPSTSRMKLLGPRSSISRSSSASALSDARSTATTSPSDGFDNWDTSHIGQQIKETVHLAVPTKGTALEPIPGSRPVSPASALDGPFSVLQQQLHSQERLQDRPLTGLSNLSQIQRPPTAFSTASGRSATPTMRPISPEISESHIHPLFRTDSPVPPPSATPGTVVTASPYSGHVIKATSRASSRTRLTDRTASPVVLSRAGSVDDLPTRSRSSSQTRVMTPPIPDFILSASREKIL